MRKLIWGLLVFDVVLIIFILRMFFVANAEYVTAPSGLRVRAEPSTESEILEVLPYGSEVNGEIESGWLRRECEDGYVCADWVSAEDPHDGWTFLGNWHLTAYTWTGNPCADGSWPQAGYSLATNELPFGSKVYIDGVGQRTVTDRGPGWLGSAWADIYMGSYAECAAWGSRYRDVWLIG